MAAFANFAAAETRAYTKRDDGTWVNAHAAEDFDGTPVVRVQRYLTSALTQGAWVEISDDATV